jgi:hypothetical protein
LPNWCDNTVRVRADAKTLTRIREAVKGTVYVRPWNDEDPSVPLPLRAEASLFSLHAVLPQPDGALEPDDPRRASAARISLSFAEPLALGRCSLHFQGGVLLRVASLSGAWAYGLRQLLP